MRMRNGSSRQNDPCFLAVAGFGSPRWACRPGPVSGAGSSRTSVTPGSSGAGPPTGGVVTKASKWSARRGGVALLLDLRLLAAQLAQVVELRPAYVAAGDQLDVVNDRRVHRERPLDADAEAHLARGEGLTHAAALAPDDHTLEDLDALAVALDHPHMHLHRVARAEIRDVAAQRGSVKRVKGLHVKFLYRQAATIYCATTARTSGNASA